MRKRTQEIRLAALIRDVKRHEHKDELLRLMEEQLIEDNIVVLS